MTSASEAEVVPDHAVKVDTELLCCPRCRCHLRLALILDQPTDYPPAQKTISLWTALVPDTAQTIIEKEGPPNTVTLEATERLAILNAFKEAGYNKLLAARMLGIGKTRCTASSKNMLLVIAYRDRRTSYSFSSKTTVDAGGAYPSPRTDAFTT